MKDMLIHEFSPLYLSIDRVGPFNSKMESIDFTDSNNESCNLFLFLSKNGRGKTTALELMAKLMSMLGHEKTNDFASANNRLPKSPFGFEHLDIGDGRAQWDIRIRYSADGVERVIVLSLIAGMIGTETSLKFWDDDALALVGAREWHRFGFCHNEVGSWSTIGVHDTWVLDFNSIIAAAAGQPLGGFEENTLVWPTLVYFSAYRNVVQVSADQQRAIVAPRDWNYNPVHSIKTDQGDWRDSLDNLLVWLRWLDDGRFSRALSLVNERVFSETTTYLRGVSKEPPEGEIVRDGNSHRLDMLSSGEKSLVQIFLRLGAHMTTNTILLIDEPEAHLHENWKFRLFEQFKKMAKDFFPGLTIIVATHSQEMMAALALELNEENVRKGGYFFESEQEESLSTAVQQKASVEYGQL